METAVAGFRVGLPGLFVFAAFVYNPALLFVGSAMDIILSTIGCLAGVVCCAAAIQGHAFKKINIPTRLLLFFFSLVVLSPRWDLTIVGSFCGVFILWLNYVSAKKAPPFGAAPISVAAKEAG